MTASTENARIVQGGPLVALAPVPRVSMLPPMSNPDLRLVPRTPPTPLHDLASLTGRSTLPPALWRANGMKRLDWVLGLPDPAGYVESLATEELFLLMRDIGEHDAYPLLEYATPEQIQGIHDLALWTRNEVQLDRWIKWLDLAQAVDLDTAIKYVQSTEPELIELLFCKDIQVHAADLDPDTVPDELALFQTPDGTFWVTVPHEHELAERLPGLMKLLWAADMDRMRDIFQASRFELASQLEETLIRFRGGRLEDMGFPSPDEAAELYERVEPRGTREALLQMVAERQIVPPPTQGAVAQDLALSGVRPPDLLGAALRQLSSDERAQFAQGFTYLVNKVFMARSGDLGQTDDLPVAAGEAAALVNLGLAYAAREDVDQASDLVRFTWPEQLFRLGYGLTAELGLKARKLRRRAGASLDLHVFGTPTEETLEGAALPRPVFFEGLDERARVGWRPFATLADVSHVEAVIHEADAVLTFFETRLGFSPEALMGAALGELTTDERRQVRLETLLRTGIAQALLTEAFSFAPLSREDVAAFVKLAFAEDGTLTPLVRGALDRLAGDLDPALVAWMEAAMADLVSAFGRVAAHDLDPNYVAELLLVRR